MKFNDIFMLNILQYFNFSFVVIWINVFFFYYFDSTLISKVFSFLVATSDTANAALAKIVPHMVLLTNIGNFLLLNNWFWLRSQN